MLKEVVMYTIICDRCGADANENQEFAAWSDPGAALDIATDSDWFQYDGRHYCEQCGVPPCVCGHLYAEHEYEAGAPCQSCDCGEFVAPLAILDRSAEVSA